MQIWGVTSQCLRLSPCAESAASSIYHVTLPGAGGSSACGFRGAAIGFLPPQIQA